MRRLQLLSFTVDTPPRQGTARTVSPPAAPPRDDMWRSRRVLSGSNWMDAWVRKPGQR